MIKCEIDEKTGTGVAKIDGNEFVVILEMKHIIDTLIENKRNMIVETIFLDLARHYTKEECYGYIQSAYQSMEQTKQIKDQLDDLLKILTKNIDGEE